MTRPCTDTAICANSAPPKTGIKSPRNGDANLAVVQCLRGLFDLKIGAALRGLLGLSDGGARKKVSCERELSVDEIAALLRSDHGRDILVALMADAEPHWWRAFKAYMHAVDARQYQARANRKLREAIDAADDIEDALERADDALALRHTHVDRQGVAARRGMGGLRGRALAAQAIGGKAR